MKLDVWRMRGENVGIGMETMHIRVSCVNTRVLDHNAIVSLAGQELLECACFF